MLMGTVGSSDFVSEISEFLRIPRFRVSFGRKLDSQGSCDALCFVNDFKKL